MLNGQLCDRERNRIRKERGRWDLWWRFVLTRTLRTIKSCSDPCEKPTNVRRRRAKSHRNSPSRHLARPKARKRLLNSHLGHTHFSSSSPIGCIRERVSIRAWPGSVKTRWWRWTPSGPHRTPELLMEPCPSPPHDTHLPRPHLTDDITRNDITHLRGLLQFRKNKVVFLFFNI